MACLPHFGVNMIFGVDELEEKWKQILLAISANLLATTLLDLIEFQMDCGCN